MFRTAESAEGWLCSYLGRIFKGRSDCAGAARLGVSRSVGIVRGEPECVNMYTISCGVDYLDLLGVVVGVAMEDAKRGWV